MKCFHINEFRKIFSVLLMLPGFCVMGQGLSNYNLYTVNQYAINPAYVGKAEGLFTALHFKNHLSGLNNAPRNLMFVVHSPIGEKLGLGGNVTAAQEGLFKNTFANIAASYRVSLAGAHQLTFGLSAGIVMQNLDMSQVSNSDLTDPTLQSAYRNNNYYRFGYGAIYNWNNVEVSVSFPNAIQQENHLLRSYFLGMASYKIAATNDIVVKPSVLYKSLPVTKDQVDIFVRGQWKDLVSAQAGYRTNKNLVLGGGLTLENMNINYAYELPSATKALSKGTHEIVLSFVFGKKKAIAKAKTAKAPKAVLPVDSSQHHIKMLEEEVKILKGQLGEQPHEVVEDTVRLSENTIFSYDANEKFVKIYPGNYVVIQTCSTHDFANRLIKMYKAKGINTFKVYDQTQRLFFIVEKYFPTFLDAEFEMDKMKDKGYKNCWILIY
jgi:type IX secretion system PorP/SprF family membrane protein